MEWGRGELSTCQEESMLKITDGKVKVLYLGNCKYFHMAEMYIYRSWEEGEGGSRWIWERQGGKRQGRGRTSRARWLLLFYTEGSGEPLEYLKEKDDMIRLQFHRETTTVSSHLETEAAIQAENDGGLAKRRWLIYSKAANNLVEN